MKLKKSERQGFSKNNSQPFQDFQLRWNEALGLPDKPYMHRYVLNLKWFSLRLHIWHGSDDTRFMHDHGWDFVTFVLKGSYTDVTESGEEQLTAGSVRYRPAEHLHYVGSPKNPTVTLLFCGPPKRKWGFKVGDKMMRPLRFFSRYGHMDTMS